MDKAGHQDPPGNGAAAADAVGAAVWEAWEALSRLGADRREGALRDCLGWAGALAGADVAAEAEAGVLLADALRGGSSSSPATALPATCTMRPQSAAAPPELAVWYQEAGSFKGGDAPCKRR